MFWGLKDDQINKTNKYFFEYKLSISSGGRRLNGRTTEKKMGFQILGPLNSSEYLYIACSTFLLVYRILTFYQHKCKLDSNSMYSLYFTIIQRLHFIGVHTSIDTFIFSSCPKCPIPNFILNKVMSKTETHLTELVRKKEGQGGDGWGSLFLNDSLHLKKNLYRSHLHGHIMVKIVIKTVFDNRPQIIQANPKTIFLLFICIL